MQKIAKSVQNFSKYHSPIFAGKIISDTLGSHPLFIQQSYSYFWIGKQGSFKKAKTGCFKL